jgi:hypothetical protein
MFNQKFFEKKSKVTVFLSLLLLLALILSACGTSATPTAAPAPAKATPAAQPEPKKAALPAAETDPGVRFLMEELTFVHLLSDEGGYAKTACAGNGLKNIKPAADGPKVLIPNVGDLSLAGANVSVKLNPDGELTFIPRTQGEKIRVPLKVGSKAEGEETLSLTFDEARQLIMAGKLIWTGKDAKDAPGHIANCGK